MTTRNFSLSGQRTFTQFTEKPGGSLNYDEIVAYTTDAVLPQYVVVYELNGAEKIAK